MTLGYTLHQIIRGQSQLGPNTVEEFTEDGFDEMKKLGAVREPTQNEMDLYYLTHNRPTAAPVAVVKGAVVEPTEREKLETRAAELGVEFSPRIGDAKLAERIAEAETELAKKAAVDLDRDVTNPPGGGALV